MRQPLQMPKEID